MFELTREQRQAIESNSKPTMVFAGAGAGKTRVLVEKYLKLLEEGLTPSQILCLTFTTDAAEEMKERLSHRLSERNSNLKTLVENTPNIGTIHSFCYQTLNQFGSELGLSKVEEILSPFTFASEFETFYEEHLNKIDPDTLKKLLTNFTHVQLHDLVLELYQKRHTWMNEVKDDSTILTSVLDCCLPFIEKLQNHFYNQGQYSFDDLEVLSIRVFEQTKIAKERLNEQYKAVLIDEFQDVSRSQWNWLRQIALSHPKGLFLVGDPKQSIYGFRYSEPELFYETAKKLSDSHSNVVELNVNFRTHERLLGSINTLSSRLFKDIPFSHMLPGLNEPVNHRYFDLHYFDCSEENARGEVQKLELDEITRKVKNIVDSGVLPNQIALLFRNADRMLEYQRKLNAYNIPASLTHTLSFSDSYEILDLISFLSVCLNPLDNASLCQFLRSPYMGYSFEQLSNLSQPSDISLYERLLISKEPSLNWLFTLIDSGEMDVDQLLKLLFKNTTYFPKSPEAFLFFLEAKEKCASSLYELLTQLRTLKSHSLFTSVESLREDAVKLMTVHAAKGLEFDYVLLCDNLRQTPVSSPFVFCRAGQGMGIRYKENNEIVKTPTYQKLYEMQRLREQEESHRILYVALTRAKKSLSLFFPKGMKKLPSGSWAQTLEECLGKSNESASYKL